MKREENKNGNGSFRAARPASGGHLSDEEIIAYNYGNFPSPQAERRAQNHLVECRRCANLLLELSEFAASADAPAIAESTDVRWARFERKRNAAAEISAAKIFSSENSPAAEPNGAPPFWKGFFKLPAFNFAPAAAALGLLALIALGGIFLAFFAGNENPGVREAVVAPNVALPPPRDAGNQSLAPEKTVADAAQKNASESAPVGGDANRRIFKHGNQNSQSPAYQAKNKTHGENLNSPPPPKIAAAPAPQDELTLNRIDVSLYPNEVVRDGGGNAADDVRKIRVGQNSVGQIRLKLNAPKSEARRAFSIEISDSQSETVLTLPVLPDARGDFYLTIPAAKLPAARYRLKLYNEKNKIRSLYAEYGFEIEQY